jgi:hypothetical protein
MVEIFIPSDPTPYITDDRAQEFKNLRAEYAYPKAYLIRSPDGLILRAQWW